ncbi:MotA/TolQ/ExbB proton channel family protein [Candidatus Albibeggiatoa sp. nov. NOAA]|uniref:MotA/TolQ/ExbB proton channel family protein n=1 Tax=Candidatus Albibeggiatoa sp. nov. NOAA TaxID=3162724 RepID=UPI003341B7BA
MQQKTASFGIEGFIQHVQDNPIALTVLVILLFMSVLSWYVILSKSVQLWWVRWRSGRYQRLFWNTDNLQIVIERLRKKKAANSFARLCEAGINATLQHRQAATERQQELCSHSEFITRSLHHCIDKEREQLNSGLGILASVGSTAPFVGLLGTVIGIYHALVSISASGQASLDTVAGPVGEALIMTAIGLAVAIPAVLGYNMLNKGNRRFLHRLNTSAHHLHAYLNAGVRVDKHNLHTLSHSNEPVAVKG